jgi:glycosyltransferase involved in cell wall biosynthesis
VVHHYARKYGIPYVLDAHGSLTRTSGGKRGPGWLLKSLFDITFGYRILKGASKVIAETEAGVKEYEKLGISGEKITLIPPSFSLEEFSRLPPEGQFRTRYGIGEKQLIMFLGRIHRIKGLDFLVESFYELTQLRNDVILVIVGPDDGYKSTLDDLIARLNLSDKVLFTGFLSGEEKVSALVDANVVVQTSIYEYGIRAPIEAILCDTPIIVTRHTGAGEIVSKMDAGYLVEYGNTKQLSNMMGYVLDNPSEAKSKIRVAKQYIRVNLSIERGAEKYESVYVDCIAANVNTSRLSRKHNGN